MNWREHSWELVVSALSWVVAIVAIVCIGVFVALDAGKRRWALRRALTTNRAHTSSALLGEMEMPT